MINQEVDRVALLQHLIDEKLKPYVKKIDVEAFYAEEFLRELGRNGFFLSEGKPEEAILQEEAYVVKEVAKVCMTTAFCLWCHLASMTYVRNTTNQILREHVLSQLENGKLLGGTGLSNPMKYLANMETIHLQAERVDDGYIINGALPYISNLGSQHGFGFVARLNEIDETGNPRLIMGFMLCNSDNFSMIERKNYIGLNGSATYACKFDYTFLPDDFIISDDANAFIELIRPVFIAYQIPLSIGVMESSINSIKKVNDKQNGCNQYLQVQAPDLEQKKSELENSFQSLTSKKEIPFLQLAKVRLHSAYLLLETVQTAMLHHGGAAYIKDSTPNRKLREAYFYANLTPTIKHLEKTLEVTSK